MSYVIQLHAAFGKPAANSSDGATAPRRALRMHVRQSVLDSACGQHCVLMALMAFGLVARETVDRRTLRGSRKLGAIVRSIRQLYGVGTYPKHLATLLNEFRPQVMVRIAHRRGMRVIRLVASALDAGALAILGIGRGRRRLDHWVLAVGWAGRATRRGTEVREVLVLDPNADHTGWTAWNASIDVARARNGRCRFVLRDEAGGCDRVFPVTAVVVWAAERDEGP